MRADRRLSCSPNSPAGDTDSERRDYLPVAIIEWWNSTTTATAEQYFYIYVTLPSSERLPIHAGLQRFLGHCCKRQLDTGFCEGVNKTCDDVDGRRFSLFWLSMNQGHHSRATYCGRRANSGVRDPLYAIYPRVLADAETRIIHVSYALTLTRFHANGTRQYDYYTSSYQSRTRITEVVPMSFGLVFVQTDYAPPVRQRCTDHILWAEGRQRMWDWTAGMRNAGQKSNKAYLLAILLHYRIKITGTNVN